jgi:hypothetical protein
MIGPSYTLRTLNYESQRTVNLFPEKDELGTGKEQEVAMLCSVPGQVLLHTLPKTPLRAVYYTANGFIYAVAGNGLYNLAVSAGVWSHTLIGILQTTTGPVSIKDGVPNYYNGIANTGLINQVVVVDGSDTGLVFEEGTTNVYQMGPSSLTVAAGSFVVESLYTILTIGTTDFTVIGATNNNVGTEFVATGVGSGTGTATFYTSSGYAGSAFVTFQDGFFLFAKPGTISAYYASDPLNINAANVINVNLGSDSISRVISDHDIVWIFSQRTLSVWQNTGGSSGSNVFQQIPGALAEGGCFAPASIAQVAGQLIWTTNDDRGYAQVAMAFGYRGVRISNHAVEDWLQSVGDISGATAWTYQDGGHSFYCLNVPGSASTWCYDVITQMWSERQYFGNGTWSRDLVEVHCNVFIAGTGTIHLCGDYQSGNLYSLDNSVYTLNGQPIRRIRTSPHMSGSLKRVYYGSFQLDIEAGVGLDGTGTSVLVGYSPTASTAQTASGVLVQGNGPTYTLLGNDGLPALPTGTVTLTSAGQWSGSYTTNATDGTVTVTPGALTQTYTNFGTGNGTQTTFPIPNFYSESVSSFSISVTDWRGTFSPAIFPAFYENLCQSSYDFNYAGIWSSVGANAVGGGWQDVTYTAATTASRPTTSTTSNLTVTNPANAYSATGLTVSTSGSAATASITGSGTLTSGSITYSGFGGGSFTGTLNVSGLFAASWGYSAGATLSAAWDGNGYQTLANIGLLASGTFDSIYMNIQDLTTLYVTITLNSVTTATTMSLYDIVCLNESLTNGPNTVATPDGSYQGTMLTEDSTVGLHKVTTTYPVTFPQYTTFSFYARKGDPARYLVATVGTQFASPYEIFDLVNGVCTGGFGQIADVGNGVYRCSMCVLEGGGVQPSGTSVTGSAIIYLSPAYSALNLLYPGNGSSSVGIWGAQIEVMPAYTTVPSQYLVTNGATAVDFCTFFPQSGSVSFNVAPFGSVSGTVKGTLKDLSIPTVSVPAATISATITVNAPSLGPAEFAASFSYNEATPIYQTIGTNPQVGLSYSDDGGHTFSPERQVSLGAIGARGARAIWRRLGMSRDRVFRVTCNDPVKFCPIGAEIDAKVGDS